jgi:hypothetical protein
MIEGCPFLYRARDGAIYHVNENGVKEISGWSWSSTEKIVAYVDGDEGHYESTFTLRNPEVQIILASSPRGTN